MISVCIPIHNYNVLPLSESIISQAKCSNCDVELVCIDDGSAQYYVEHNRPVEGMGQYIVLEHNVGRAAVRNLFLKYANGSHLIFLDDDCIVPERFIERYRAAAADNPAVVVGGRLYDDRFDDREHRLRYKYGTNVECRNATERSRDPHRSFMSNNFMIRRDVLQSVLFDDRLKGYGHEDTLFGFRLWQQNIPILHIDNPVTNGDVEDNALFLSKTEEAVRSLAQIYTMTGSDKDFCHSVRLLRIHSIAEPVDWLLLAAFKCSRRILRNALANGKCTSLPLFNFYKLGLLIECLTHGAPASGEQ